MPAISSSASHFPRKPTARASDPVLRHAASRTTARGNKSHPLPTPHTEKVFRIQKSKDVHLAPKSQPTVEKFSDYLDEHRENLYKDAEKALHEAEIKHMNAVRMLADQFELHLSLLTKSERQLAISIANDQISTKLCLDKHSPDKQPGPRSISLGQDMSEFSALVTAKQAALEDLFDDWNNVQCNIIALAVQVLGRDSVEITNHFVHEDLAKAIDESANKQEDARNQVTAALGEVASVEAKAKDLTANTERVVVEAYQDLIHQLEILEKEAEAANEKRKQIRDRFFS